jgi:glycosyltransferase involved in cell wall biosynthesis
VLLLLNVIQVVCLVESSNAENENAPVETVKVFTGRPIIVAGIPAFNEEKTIASVVLKAHRYADKVVVCDDGSTDLTGEIAEKLGAEVIRHECNLGYGAAIGSLFRRARELDADVFVTLDGDGQHNPAEIPRVVKPAVDGTADVVIGSRFVDQRFASVMPWYRRAGVQFITKLANNSAKHGVKDAQSGFRAYSRKALEKLRLTENGMGVSFEILHNAGKCGLKIVEVSASCKYGEGVGRSSRNPLRHGAEVVMSIVRLVIEERPLLCLGLPGIAFFLVGAYFGAWMLQVYTLEHRIETNIALASISFILIGMFTLFAAVTLYAISRLTQRVNSAK